MTDPLTALSSNLVGLGCLSKGSGEYRYAHDIIHFVLKYFGGNTLLGKVRTRNGKNNNIWALARSNGILFDCI